MSIYVQTLLYTSYFSVLIPLISYIVNIRRVGKPIHIIGVLVLVSGLCDLIGFLLIKQKLSTALVINTYFITQFCLLSFYYYETLFRNKSDLVHVIGVVQFFLAFLIATYFYKSIAEEHQNIMWFISSIILIVYGISFLKKMRNGHAVIYKLGHFWINGAVLFYLSASLWLFAFTSDSIMLKLGHNLSQLIWSFYDINNVVKNVLFAIGIYYSSTETIEGA